MEPTHPDRLVENVTAPFAGGFPGPVGEVRLKRRLPFRTGSSSGSGSLSVSVSQGCVMGLGPGEPGRASVLLWC
ncbi:MAG: hypothetical protein ACOX52_17430 [Verrucomicrobiota bacterium]